MPPEALLQALQGILPESMPWNYKPAVEVGKEEEK